MPFVINGARRGGRLVTAALGLTLFAAVPAHAAGISNPTDCTPDASLSQTFAGWNDPGQYTPAPDGGLENGAEGWTLSGGASVIPGNEPWNVGGPQDDASLDLPPGSSAVTAPMCIDQTYPYFRLFARKAPESKGALKIDVLFLDAKGNVTATKPFSHSSVSSDWEPTGTVKIGLFTAKTTVSAAPVRFRFTPHGGGSHYQIDDVYVDPWARN